MGILLDREINQSIIEEFQQCKLGIFDTNRVRDLFCEFRKKQFQNNHQFGLNINANKLSEWMSCDINASIKLINRWKSVAGRHETPKVALLKKRQTKIQQELSPHATISLINDEGNIDISMLPIFCAMALISSGTISEKLRLIIYFFEESKFGSVPRKVFDIIVEHIILTICILLDLHKSISKLQRKTKRHIYDKNTNDSMKFKEISRGTLAIWLATSPYVTKIFCLCNTTDAQKRNKFLRKFYKIKADSKQDAFSPHSAISIIISPKSQKHLFRDAQSPSLSAVSNKLKNSYLDCSNEHSIDGAFKMISHSYSAKALRRNIFGVSDLPNSDELNEFNIRWSLQKHLKAERIFDRVDSINTLSTPKRGIPEDTQMKQYYGGKTPFDAPPVAIDKILANFENHFKLSLKVQRAIRAPALVNEHNVKAVIEGFKALSNGKDYIERKDIMFGTSMGMVSRTLNRIFNKSDVRKSHRLKIEEFINSQFGGANNEELDRALSYREKPPKVYGWTGQKMKALFAELAEWNGSMIHKEPKVAMNEFWAICVHCEDIRDYVIRATRLQRDRSREEVTFKECCLRIFKDNKWNPHSLQSEILWSWLLPTEKEPRFNETQKNELKILFSSLEQKSDGTISEYQLQNVTDWIMPYTFNESLLPYLFQKCVDEKETKFRCNYKDFEYFMEYIWFIFQHNFIRYKMTKMRDETKLNISCKEETAFEKKQSFKRKKRSSHSSSRSHTISSSAPSTAKSDRINPKRLIKYAESIKNSIQNQGYFLAEETGKHKHFWSRYWSICIRMRSQQNAWSKLINLAIYVQDIEKREASEDAIFEYLDALKGMKTVIV